VPLPEKGHADWRVLFQWNKSPTGICEMRCAFEMRLTPRDMPAGMGIYFISHCGFAAIYHNFRRKLLHICHKADISFCLSFTEALFS